MHCNSRKPVFAVCHIINQHTPITGINFITADHLQISYNPFKTFRPFHTADLTDERSLRFVINRFEA
jgi:hypothetical protein